MDTEFLTGRTQRVQCKGLSTQAAITSDVIQGSCFGPILWSILMDSLLLEIEIPSVAFADDFKLLACLTRHSHKRILITCKRILIVFTHGLKVCECHSISKCLVIHYSVNNPHFQYDCGPSILPASDTFVDLV